MAGTFLILLLELDCDVGGALSHETDDWDLFDFQGPMRCKYNVGIMCESENNKNKLYNEIKRGNKLLRNWSI